jgi:O-antigen/teichoic acid export membrane protein
MDFVYDFGLWPHQIFLGTIAIAPDMVPVVFGEKWAPSIPVFQILSLIGLLRSIFLFNDSIIVSIGNQQWRMFLQLSLAIGNVLIWFDGELLLLQQVMPLSCICFHL